MIPQRSDECIYATGVATPPTLVLSQVIWITLLSHKGVYERLKTKIFNRYYYV